MAENSESNRSESDIVDRGPRAHASVGGNGSQLRPIVLPSDAVAEDRPPVCRAVEPTALEPLLTFAQAARMLGISLRQFRRLADSGKIAFVRVSERAPRVRPRELQRFLDASIVKYSEVKS